MKAQILGVSIFNTGHNVAVLQDLASIQDSGRRLHTKNWYSLIAPDS